MSWGGGGGIDTITTKQSNKQPNNFSLSPSSTLNIIKGVCGINPYGASDAMSNSPRHSQLNTRKFGSRIW